MKMDILAGSGKDEFYTPVFSTYDQNNPNQKHTNAWFVFESDAIEWAKKMNELVEKLSA